jgi:hypothetical protein
MINNIKHHHVTIMLLFFFLIIKTAMAENLLIDYDEMNYNVKRQSTFIVTIVGNEEKEWKFGFGTTIGLYLNVKYLNKEYIIPVAPVWYLQNKDEFKQNPTITVTGVIQNMSGKDIILPKLIAIGNAELLLRNYDGKPFWNSSYNLRNYKTVDNSQEKNQGMKGRGGRRGMGNFK